MEMQDCDNQRMGQNGGAFDDRTRLNRGELPPFALRDIVTEGARAWPTRPALVDGDAVTTFIELRRRVAEAARCLSAESVQARDRVAILGRRSTATVVALFAAATLGATYVALDPDQPLARVEWLLVDADVRVIVAEDDLIEPLSARLPDTKILSMTKLADAWQRETRRDLEDPAATEVPCTLRSGASLLRQIEPTDSAYILYTSGSTGRPKGVPIDHANILAFFEAHNERVDIRPGDRCLSTGPFHFDVSILDVLLPLYRGATVYLAPKTLAPTLVLGMLSKHAITHFYAVGTVLRLITGDGSRLDRFDLSPLRVLQTGAEVCNVRVVNEWLKRYPRLSFLNSYGPTEATVGCVSYLKPHVGPLRDATCPIGKPHRGTDVKLVDETGVVLESPFTTGELVIAGPQVMRGYFRRPEETRRAFLLVADRYYYRTGDQACVDADGNYHFVGRVDDEVKLHGYRIHLNEIKRVLEEDPRVEHAVLGIISPTGENELVALVVSRGGTALETLSTVASRAKSLLATYMLPSRWAALREVPQLPSGKADRSTLLSTLTQAAKVSRAAYFEGNALALHPVS
jgi:amino acid adenylation domain-containing protein